MTARTIRPTVRTALVVLAVTVLGACVPDPATPTPTPTPTPTVSISFAPGALIYPTGCEAGCRRVVVEATGFPANSSLPISCRDNGGDYYAYVVTTDSAGASTSSVCFFGYGPANPTYVVAGGIESNRIPLGF